LLISKHVTILTTFQRAEQRHFGSLLALASPHP